MTLYENSTMEYYHNDGSIVEGGPCEVIIGDDDLTISYFIDSGQAIVYHGKRIGDNSYKLTAPAINGRATLHRFPDDDVFEGTWIEDKSIGMWRVFIDNE